MHMTSTSQYLQISSHGQQWHDLCASPCKFQMPPGVIELLFYGNGVTEAQEQFVVRPGSNVIRVDPGSNAAYQGFRGAGFLGLLAMTMGATLLVIAAASPEYERDYSTDERVRDPTVAKYWSWGAWLTGLGSVGFVGGMIGRRLTDTEVDIEHGDPPATTSGRSREGSASPPFGASLKGTF